MIDFRYHLVSLISVFLALALGIVVGTTKLNGRVLDDLRDQVQGLSDDKRNLATHNRDLEQQVGHDDEFAGQAAPRLVKDVLKDTTVVIVSADGADDGAKNGVQKMVEQAGAEVTGRIQLTNDYTDPRRSSGLKEFVTGSGLPAGFELPDSNDSGVLTGALLSHVLVKPEAGDAAPEADIEQVLSGLSVLGVLRLETKTVRPADYAVLVTTGVPSGEGAVERANTITELALQLNDDARGAVVAGDAEAASDEGAIGRIREDDTASPRVSTVDNADRPGGQVATVFALAEQKDGRTGQYGEADNAQEAFPSMDDPEE